MRWKITKPEISLRASIVILSYVYLPIYSFQNPPDIPNSRPEKWQEVRVWSTGQEKTSERTNMEFIWFFFLYRHRVWFRL